jgi:hypothetical protein
MQLVKYFCMVLVSVLLITAAATWVADKGLQRSNVDFYGKMNAAGLAEDKTNLLLIGSSRVLKHLDPKIIDSVCNSNAYNYGLNSGTIKTWYNIMEYALRFKKNVKVIVLNVDYNMFDLGPDPYKDAYYYPFEKNVDTFAMSNSGTPWLVHNARIFDVALYDDYAKYAAIDGWLRKGRVIEGVYKGYYPNQQVDTFERNAAPGATKKNITVDQKGIDLLNSCIELCKQRNVQLVLVVAPYFDKYGPEKYYNNFTAIINDIQMMAARNNIPFYNYTAIPLAHDQQYFYNVNHLNGRGAGLYSVAVADSIKKYF